MEFEYEIPYTDAKELLEKMCIKPFIEKYRYKIPYKGFIWEVDDFLGKNKGLIIAEIELESEDQKFEKPEWIGEEVSSNLKYYNSFLVHHPYCNW